MSEESLVSLYARLREDTSRTTRSFSPDMEKPTVLAHHPYATREAIAEGMSEWCAKRQPCYFGRLAAARRQIHIFPLREPDLAGGDDAVAELIAEAKRLWKQRAATVRQRPPHAFLLMFVSPRVYLAAPDDNLRRFADRLLSLAGWNPDKRQRSGANSISSDFLYLPHPDEGIFYGYQFNVDFFASAGDGTWWHDHRIPGGIGFTANSTGHMRYYRDWYEHPGSDHGAWALTQAMQTIDNAHVVADKAGGAHQGRVTWLIDVGPKGETVVPNVPCPLRDVPKSLQGKDWTRYEGLLHTDHAVREEFFAAGDIPVTSSNPYLMDFTYLYDKRQQEFINFTQGVRVAEDQVYGQIGRPETWTHRTAPVDPALPPQAAAEIAELLAACQALEPMTLNPPVVDS